MELYEAIYNRRIVRDFQDKTVPEEVLERIINAGLQAPTHDHLRNWEFVILQDKKDKEQALQFISNGVKPQLEILKQILVNGTPQQKMYAVAMPRQYSMLFNASHIILPFFKSNSGVMHEGINVAKVVGAPDDYLLPCYIGLGYPADDKPFVEQVEYTAKQKMHFGKW